MGIRLVEPGEDVEEGSSLLDIPATLRALADNIESGKHGVAIRAAVVVRSAGLPPIVCGMGRTDPAQTHMDLHAGMIELVNMIAPTR